MVSIINQKVVSDGRIYADVFCTSEDTKPVGGFCTGASCVYVDNGKAFLYDAGAENWFEVNGESMPSVIISYDMKGHGTQVADSTVTWGQTTSAPTPPTATGYTFGGWYDEPACENAHDWTAKALNKTTVYAKWTAVEYTITYNLDGGTNSTNNPAKFTIESPDIVFEDATKEDYEFKGWYGNSSFAGDPVTGVESGSHANVTVYAKFEAVEAES